MITSIKFKAKDLLTDRYVNIYSIDQLGYDPDFPILWYADLVTTFLGFPLKRERLATSETSKDVVESIVTELRHNTSLPSETRYT